MVSDWYLYWEEEVEGATATTSAPVSSGPAPALLATTTVDASPAYYTSSYHTAKYWYPASCSGWHSLSKAYLEFPFRRSRIFSRSIRVAVKVRGANAWRRAEERLALSYAATMSRAMDIITEVKKLDLPLGQYVVIGSGIMAQLGLREANDVDIAVTAALYATLRASGDWDEEERYGKIFLKQGAVEINPRLDWERYATTTEEAIASATIIDGVPFINFNELVMFKRVLGRGRRIWLTSLLSRSTSQDEPVTPNAHAHQCRWRGGWRGAAWMRRCCSFIGHEQQLT